MNTVKQFLQKAQDFRQYDQMHWEVEGAAGSPSRAWYCDVLHRNGPALRGKRVLDIGSGVGHLFSFLEKNQVMEISGIEPSARNFRISKKLYPTIQVYKTILQKTRLRKQFDVAVSILAFEHIADLDKAFVVLCKLIKRGGRVCIIAMDKQYAETQRFGYDMEAVHVDAQTSVTRTKRPDGTIWDIVRMPQVFIAAGKANGFVLEKHVLVKPPKSFIAAQPKYKTFVGRTMHHFYVFKKI